MDTLNHWLIETFLHLQGLVFLQLLLRLDRCRARHSRDSPLIPVLLPFCHLGYASVSRSHIKRWKQRGDKFLPHNLPLSSDPSAASFVLSAIS